MKKSKIAIIAVVALLVVALVVCLVVYFTKKDEGHSFEAVVVETSENSLLVYKVQDDNNRLCYLNLSTSELKGQDGSKISVEDIRPGELVQVRHGDVVQESFPPIYPQVYEVKVMGQASDELFEQGKDAANWLVLPDVPDASDESIPAVSQPPVAEIPADTALYRGVVKSVGAEGNATRLTLAQAEGTNFGYPEFEVLLAEDTQSNFEPGALAEGNYVEVWYGTTMSGQVTQPVTAVVANLLPDADLCLFNGKVISFEQEEEDSGIILLESLDGNRQMQFSYDAGTSIYLDMEALAEGDMLNVFFSGASTLSLPPQALALEVRPYYAG